MRQPIVRQAHIQGVKKVILVRLGAFWCCTRFTAARSTSGRALSGGGGRPRRKRDFLKRGVTGPSLILHYDQKKGTPGGPRPEIRRNYHRFRSRAPRRFMRGLVRSGVFGASRCVLVCSEALQERILWPEIARGSSENRPETYHGGVTKPRPL